MKSMRERRETESCSNCYYGEHEPAKYTPPPARKTEKSGAELKAAMVWCYRFPQPKCMFPQGWCGEWKEAVNVDQSRQQL